MIIKKFFAAKFFLAALLVCFISFQADVSYAAWNFSGLNKAVISNSPNFLLRFLSWFYSKDQESLISIAKKQNNTNDHEGAAETYLRLWEVDKQFDENSSLWLEHAAQQALRAGDPKRLAEAAWSKKTVQLAFANALKIAKDPQNLLRQTQAQEQTQEQGYEQYLRSAKIDAQHYVNKLIPGGMSITDRMKQTMNSAQQLVEQRLQEGVAREIMFALPQPHRNLNVKQLENYAKIYNDAMSLALRSNNGKLAKKAGKRAVNIYKRIGSEAYKENNYEKAGEYFENAFEVAVKNPQGKEQQMLFPKAIILYRLRAQNTEDYLKQVSTYTNIMTSYQMYRGQLPQLYDIDEDYVTQQQKMYRQKAADALETYMQQNDEAQLQGLNLINLWEKGAQPNDPNFAGNLLMLHAEQIGETRFQFQLFKKRTYYNLAARFYNEGRNIDGVRQAYFQKAAASFEYIDNVSPQNDSYVNKFFAAIRNYNDATEMTEGHANPAFAQNYAQFVLRHSRAIVRATSETNENAGLLQTAFEDATGTFVQAGNIGAALQLGSTDYDYYYKHYSDDLNGLAERLERLAFLHAMHGNLGVPDDVGDNAIEYLQSAWEKYREILSPENSFEELPHEAVRRARLGLARTGHNLRLLQNLQPAATLEDVKNTALLTEYHLSMGNTEIAGSLNKKATDAFAVLSKSEQKASNILFEPWLHFQLNRQRDLIQSLEVERITSAGKDFQPYDQQLYKTYYNDRNRDNPFTELLLETIYGPLKEDGNPPEFSIRKANAGGPKTLHDYLPERQQDQPFFPGEKEWEHAPYSEIR